MESTELDLNRVALLQDSHDLTEQLDTLRQQFRETTDRLISSIELSYDAVLAGKWTMASENKIGHEKTQSDDAASPGPAMQALGGRRASVFGPNHAIGAQVSAGLHQVVESSKSLRSSSSSSMSGSSTASSSSSSSTDRSTVQQRQLVVAVDDSAAEDEHVSDIRREMRRLSETSESRRAQVRHTNKQLRRAQQTLKQLRKAIKLKVGTPLPTFWF